MKKLLLNGIIIYFFISPFLLAQAKILIEYNSTLKQYEYYNSSGVSLGVSKYNNLLEVTEHFDATGQKIGETKFNKLFEEYDTFNAAGEKETTTKYNPFLEEYEQYDKYGREIGIAKYNKLLKQYEIYDENNKKIGEINLNIGIVPSAIPHMQLVVKTNNDVFGILLLPSIRKIVFNPNHQKIKKIKRIKNLSEDNQKKEGWIKSK